jgi:hypothetical protein
MLLTHAKWRKFTSRPIPPVTSSEVMLTLSCPLPKLLACVMEAATAGLQTRAPAGETEFTLP